MVRYQFWDETNISVFSALNKLNGFRCFIFLQNQDSYDAYSSSLEVLYCHSAFCKDQEHKMFCPRNKDAFIWMMDTIAMHAKSDMFKMCIKWKSRILFGEQRCWVIHRKEMESKPLNYMQQQKTSFVLVVKLVFL